MSRLKPGRVKVRIAFDAALFGADLKKGGPRELNETGRRQLGD